MREEDLAIQIDTDFLLPPCPGLKLTDVEISEHQLILHVTSTSPQANCPMCQTTSFQVHSYYMRTITDLCWADLGVRLLLRVRRARLFKPDV